MSSQTQLLGLSTRNRDWFVWILVVLLFAVSAHALSKHGLYASVAYSVNDHPQFKWRCNNGRDYSITRAGDAEWQIRIDESSGVNVTAFVSTNAGNALNEINRCLGLEYLPKHPEIWRALFAPR